MNIRAVLWDMDGTLVDSESLAVEALREAMIRQGLAIPDGLHEAVVGRAADDIHADFTRTLGLRLPPAEWEQLKLRGYMARLHRLRGFAPALEVWHRLARAGIRQAVVSNSDRMIVDANLTAVGLMQPGLLTISRNDLRRGKPDPEGYLRALWLLDCPPDQALVVEDSLSGAAAGLAAGIGTLFVPHATVPAPPGVIRLPEMAALLRLVTG